MKNFGESVVFGCFYFGESVVFQRFYFWGGAGNYEPRQVGFSQKIELAKRGARKDLAKSGLKFAQKNIDYSEFDLKMDVREAYIDLVAAKSILHTLEQQELLQKDLLKTVVMDIHHHFISTQ